MAPTWFRSNLLPAPASAEAPAFRHRPAPSPACPPSRHRCSPVCPSWRPPFANPSRSAPWRRRCSLAVDLAPLPPPRRPSPSWSITLVTVSARRGQGPRFAPPPRCSFGLAPVAPSLGTARLLGTAGGRRSGESGRRGPSRAVVVLTPTVTAASGVTATFPRRPHPRSLRCSGSCAALGSQRHVLAAGQLGAVPLLATVVFHADVQGSRRRRPPWRSSQCPSRRHPTLTTLALAPSLPPSRRRCRFPPRPPGRCRPCPLPASPPSVLTTTFAASDPATDVVRPRHRSSLPAPKSFFPHRHRGADRHALGIHHHAVGDHRTVRGHPDVQRHRSTNADAGAAAIDLVAVGLRRARSAPGWPLSGAPPLVMCWPLATLAVTGIDADIDAYGRSDADRAAGIVLRFSGHPGRVDGTGTAVGGLAGLLRRIPCAVTCLSTVPASLRRPVCPWQRPPSPPFTFPPWRRRCSFGGRLSLSTAPPAVTSRSITPVTVSVEEVRATLAPTATLCCLRSAPVALLLALLVSLGTAGGKFAQLSPVVEVSSRAVVVLTPRSPPPAASPPPFAPPHLRSLLVFRSCAPWRSASCPSRRSASRRPHRPRCGVPRPRSGPPRPQRPPSAVPLVPFASRPDDHAGAGTVVSTFTSPVPVSTTWPQAAAGVLVPSSVATVY